MPGAPSRFTNLKPDGERIDLGNTDVVPLGPGDVFNLTSGGGAGFGDPFTRPVDLVVRDVLRGSVTQCAASEHYGAVVDLDGVLDSEATQALRTSHVAPMPETYSYNANRRYFEAILTDANYAALTEALTQMPVHWRHFVKHEVFQQIAALGDADRRSDGSEVWAAVDAVKTRVPGLASSMTLKEAAE